MFVQTSLDAVPRADFRRKVVVNREVRIALRIEVFAKPADRRFSLRMESVTAGHFVDLAGIPVLRARSRRQNRPARLRGHGVTFVARVGIPVFTLAEKSLRAHPSSPNALSKFLK